VDVSTEEGNKYVLIPATRFNRQRTGEVRCRMPLNRRRKQYGQKVGSPGR
jgi:hypothetical protein